jgi:hypothetical protein
MVTGLTDIIYEEKCKELGLQTLKEQRLQQDLMLGQRIIGEGIQGGKHMYVPQKDKPKRIRTRQVAEISNFYSRIDARKFSLGGAGC